MQPGGLVPRARGRIYVACGKRPAAGGLYVFLLYPGALPNAFVSSCACWHLWVSLWHFAGPCGVSLALRVALGIHCGTLGLHFDTHGVQLGVFWALWGDLGASFRHPGASFGYPWGPWWCLVRTFGCGPGPLVPLLWKKRHPEWTPKLKQIQ